MRAVTIASCHVCGSRLTMGDPETVCADCELIMHARPRPTLLGWIWRGLQRALGMR